MQIEVWRFTNRSMNKSESPKSISISKDPPGIVIEWPDGLQKTLSFVTLRKECPCAACKGERTPLDASPMQLPVSKPTSPEATICKNMFKIGGYALGFKWGDGHDSGIYSYEYLRALAEALP